MTGCGKVGDDVLEWRMTRACERPDDDDDDHDADALQLTCVAAFFIRYKDND